MWSRLHRLGLRPSARQLAVLPGLVLICGLSACGPKNPPKFPFESADAALAAFDESRTAARSLRAEAKVEQWGEDGRIRGTVMMFVERPDRVRFDAMTQFGPAAILTSDGTAFALTDLRENRYLEGPTCPENIERLLGISMGGAEVARLLFGDSPRIEASRETIRVNDEGNYEVRREGHGGLVQRLEFSMPDEDRQAPPSEQRLRLIKAEVHDGDKLQWRATYERYRTVQSEHGERVALPYKFRFVEPRREVDTSLRFERVDLNVQVPDGAFQQTPRAGVSVESVPCDL